jgi:DNA-binding response OmpR family regulator
MAHFVLALQKAGFEVSVVRGWASTLEILQRTQPALLLVCSTAETDAIRVLRGITRAPILALLADSEEVNMIDVLTAGADDCQPASIEPREVVVRVRNLLRRAEWQQHPGAPIPSPAPYHPSRARHAPARHSAAHG